LDVPPNATRVEFAGIATIFDTINPCTSVPLRLVVQGVVEGGLGDASISAPTAPVTGKEEEEVYDDDVEAVEGDVLKGAAVAADDVGWVWEDVDVKAIGIGVGFEVDVDEPRGGVADDEDGVDAAAVAVTDVDDDEDSVWGIDVEFTAETDCKEADKMDALGVNAVGVDDVDAGFVGAEVGDATGDLVLLMLLFELMDVV
jgi:hypothetical protein